MQSIRHLLVILAVLASFCTFSHAEKYALLVGINNYAHIKGLKYCESDVALFQESLVKFADVKKENCKVILGSEATKAGVLAGFDWLAQKIQPDDQMIFYFSGHGAQARDLDGDEDDNRDEVLCTYDIEGGKRQTYLLDDELSQLLDKVNTTDRLIILDCCHSGTATRFQPQEVRQKTIHLEDLPDQGERDMILEFLLTDESETIAITACAADQIALEAKKHQHGLLTYYLTKHMHISLEKEREGLPFRELHAKVLAEIQSNGYNQTPQLEGPYEDRYFIPPNSGSIFHGDVLFLGERDVNDLQAQSILVSLGGEDGVTAGSVYAVYRSLADVKSGAKKGEIVINHVRQSESTARVEGRSFAIEPGDKIVLSEQKQEDRELLIAIGGMQSTTAGRATVLREILIEFLADEPSVKRIDDDALADGMLIGDIREQSGQTQIEIALVNMKIGEAEQTYAVSLASDPTKRAMQQALASPLDNLRQKLAFNQAVRILAGLENRNSQFEVKISVDKGTGGVYHLGETIKYYAEASQDCYLMLIAITAGGETYLLYPNEMQSENFVKAGERFTIPPEDMDAEIVLEPPAGTEIIKAIATRHRLNLESLHITELIQKLDASIAKSTGSKRGPKFKKKEGWAVDTAVYFVVE